MPRGVSRRQEEQTGIQVEGSASTRTTYGQALPEVICAEASKYEHVVSKATDRMVAPWR